MSQHDETFKTPRRDKTQKLRTPHMRALRKELLIARADVERMEMRQATLELRESVTHLNPLRLLMPGGRRGKRGALSAGGGIGVLFKQYPIVGSIASLVLTKSVRTKLLGNAKPLLKWGGLGFAGWEAWRIYQQMQAPSADTANDTADPTVF